MGERLATAERGYHGERLARPRACNSTEGLVPIVLAPILECLLVFPCLEAPSYRGKQIVTSPAVESKFVELVRAWLVSLPHDLKIAFDAMDDENLPRQVRELATGVVVYVVSPKDSSADRNDAIVGYTDDALLLRLALQKGLAKGEDEQAFRDRFPELFDDLDDNLKLCKSVMGDLMTWIEGKVGSLRAASYKGKKIATYL